MNIKPNSFYFFSKETLLSPYTLQECGHHFCEGCINPYIGKHRACPKCELPAISKGLIKNTGLQNVLLNLSKLKDWIPSDFPPSSEELPLECPKKYTEESLANLLFTPTQDPTTPQAADSNSEQQSPAIRTPVEPACDISQQAPLTPTPKSGYFKTPLVFAKVTPSCSHLTIRT